MSILETKNLGYSYNGKSKVLEDISISFDVGKMYAILGPSGCGKTTLLSLLGGLDVPTKGEVVCNGENINKLGLAKHRHENVSFIFQAYNLIDYPVFFLNLAPHGIFLRRGLIIIRNDRNFLFQFHFILCKISENVCLDGGRNLVWEKGKGFPPGRGNIVASVVMGGFCMDEFRANQFIDGLLDGKISGIFFIQHKVGNLGVCQGKIHMV